MTGLKTIAAVGAVSAIGYTALRLSRIKSGIETSFALPQIFGLVRSRYIRIIIPTDIYNYSNEQFIARRFHIVVKYTDNKGVENLLGISPTIIPVLDFKKDKVNRVKFELDLDPFMVLGLSANTPITVYIKFDFWYIPISVPIKVTLNDFIPLNALNAIKILLKTFGLGNPVQLNQLPSPFKGMGDVL